MQLVGIIMMLAAMQERTKLVSRRKQSNNDSQTTICHSHHSHFVDCLSAIMTVCFKLTCLKLTDEQEASFQAMPGEQCLSIANKMQKVCIGILFKKQSEHAVCSIPTKHCS